MKMKKELMILLLAVGLTSSTLLPKWGRWWQEKMTQTEKLNKNAKYMRSKKISLNNIKGYEDKIRIIGDDYSSAGKKYRLELKIEQEKKNIEDLHRKMRGLGLK